MIAVMLGELMEAKIYDYLPEDAIFIRTEVFVKEQKFEEEFDAIDEQCKHLVLYDMGKPIGNCRFYQKSGDSYVIGRLAVLNTHRGLGIGKTIIQEAEEYIKGIGGREVTLSAQVRVREFYEGQGYTGEGETYLEEYCPHILMRKQL